MNNHNTLVNPQIWLTDERSAANFGNLRICQPPGSHSCAAYGPELCGYAGWHMPKA